MDRPLDPTFVTLDRLAAELDRSRDDVAAGRLVPVDDVLAAIRTRASLRIEARNQAGRQKLTDPG